MKKITKTLIFLLLLAGGATTCYGQTYTINYNTTTDILWVIENVHDREELMLMVWRHPPYSSNALLQPNATVPIHSPGPHNGTRSLSWIQTGEYGGTPQTRQPDTWPTVTQWYSRWMRASGAGYSASIQSTWHLARINNRSDPMYVNFDLDETTVYPIGLGGTVEVNLANVPGMRHFMISVIHNGNKIYDNVFGSLTRGVRFYQPVPLAVPEPPVLLSSPGVDTLVGAPVDWTGGVQARWARNATLLIPGNGEIKNTALNASGTDPRVSTDGILFDRIGVVTQPLEIRDWHSLNPNIPQDNSVLHTSRNVTVRTLESPDLQIHYDTNYPVDFPGRYTRYDVTAMDMPCGGEDGWTNKNLLFDSGADPLRGNRHVVIQTDGTTQVYGPGGSEEVYDYNVESDTSDGTTVTAFLTEIDVHTNILSGIAATKIKIDTTPPTAAATHGVGFHFTDDSVDALSGLSSNNKTQIAFTTPSASTVAPTSGWEDIDTHTMDRTGYYDVWVRATDKALNQSTAKVCANLYVGGEVTIAKTTDKGAVMHERDCTNFENITMELTCKTDCDIDGNYELEESTAFHYELSLTNLALGDDAVGTFEDYLPSGVTITSTPSATADGSAVVNVSSSYVTSGPYAGRYQVVGSYSALAPGETITVEVPSETPVFDETPGESNVIHNQAKTDYTIGTGMSQITGSNLSNYATHRVKISGVKTIFTKVGADDITTGLAGGEFALYRWDGMDEPTLVERNHMIDATVLVDTSLPGGDWTRVKYSGEDATALTDIFVSSGMPLGDVDLGNLLEGVYTLVETKAPSGYELPVGQWVLIIDPSKTDNIGDYKIEFVGKSHTMMPPAAIRESSGTVHTYKIINATPFLIGMSGLGGTSGLLLAGFIVMAVAGNAYVAYSYKQNKKTKE